jgi:hypothetical protein
MALSVIIIISAYAVTDSRGDVKKATIPTF